MIILFIFFILLITVLILYFLFILNSFFGYCDIPTTKKATEEIIKIILKQKPDSSNYNFYDLGCARGSFAASIKKRFPQFSVYAIDNDFLRICFAKLKSYFLSQKIFFRKEDIFNLDLRDADIVYAYLKRDLLPLLEKKLQKELKKGTLVVTNTTFFPTWKPIATHTTCFKHPSFEKIFVYVKD